MNLNDARTNYYVFTESLSNVNRQLCFAGIAVVWIFVIKDDNGALSLPDIMLYPLSCFVVGLAFDLCHYIVASASWGLYHRIKEKSGIGDKKDFGAPRYINWAPLAFFWLKVAATLVGYVLLLKLFIS